jgi:hypothetical protein
MVCLLTFAKPENICLIYIKFRLANPKTPPPSEEFSTVQVDSVVKWTVATDEPLIVGGVGSESKKIGDLCPERSERFLLCASK